jgi:hypothetical protein
MKVASELLLNYLTGCSFQRSLGNSFNCLIYVRFVDGRRELGVL